MTILCANNRLARLLRLADAQRRSQAGERVFPTLTALTVEVWLTRLGEEIALGGEVPAAQIPVRVLSGFQERLVWQQVVRAAGEDEATLALFDLDGLAQTAAEAHALASEWGLPLTAADGAEEMRQFLRWRAAFIARCEACGWLDAVAYRQRVLDWLAAGLGTLPAAVRLAGFDALSPLVARLVDLLRARGVAVSEAAIEMPPDDRHAVRLSCADAAAECRAAADWAQRQLHAGKTRLGIVVADLDARRAPLLPILDEVLDAAGLTSGTDAPSAQYNVSLGLPLARYGLVRAALALLRALARVQGLAMHEWGALLRQPYWSADGREADLRAQFDARLRERGGPRLTLAQLAQHWRAFDADGRHQLAADLAALRTWQAQNGGAQLPGVWAVQFQSVLAAARWPGERALSSSEFQTRAAFVEVLETFAALDDFLGPLGPGAAVNELGRLCREKVFQPKTPGQPPLQVLGLIEAKGAVFDALWVMGMNDALWPPPARPNPLLPARLQRQAGTPGASADVQLAFARDLHHHLLQAAPEVVFSYAEKEGERELRPSPLIAALASVAAGELPESPLLGQLAAGGAGRDDEWLDDRHAPPLAEGDMVSGGSGLLKAQAICPAWAFYRYRLGAKALETPADEGFDARQHGTLVHVLLERFWRVVADSAALQALDDNTVQARLTDAAEAALARFEAGTGEPLSPTVRRLEAERLRRLGRLWLTLERDGMRPAFGVVDCEQAREVVLGQLHLSLVADRIDRLSEDGRLIVIDYKTGGRLDTGSWRSDRRLVEPQLPLYAAVALGDEAVAGVAFANVRMRARERGFQGVAAQEGLLPGVKGLPAAAAWQALLDDWRMRLEALAGEIRAGEAGVWFEDERALQYCEVLPLLRLPERRAQFDRKQGSAA